MENITQDMEDFSLNSEDTIVTTRTVSVKAISRGLKNKVNGVPMGAGLWISRENAEFAKWVKECTKECKSDCAEHFKTLSHHGLRSIKIDDEGNEIVIPGYAIMSPRIILLQKSILLKMRSDNNMLVREWRAGESTEDNTYFCGRRYLLLFVDADNNPLHQEPIQLTAKGCFRYNFDLQLFGGKSDGGQVTGFRQTCCHIFNLLNNTNASARTDIWHCMFVFVPTFQSIEKGTGNKKQPACITTAFEIPTRETLYNYCIGKRSDPAKKFWPHSTVSYCQHVANMHKETKAMCERKGWWRRIKNEPQLPTVTEETTTTTELVM